MNLIFELKKEKIKNNLAIINTLNCGSYLNIDDYKEFCNDSDNNFNCCEKRYIVEDFCLKNDEAIITLSESENNAQHMCIAQKEFSNLFFSKYLCDIENYDDKTLKSLIKFYIAFKSKVEVKDVSPIEINKRRNENKLVKFLDKKHMNITDLLKSNSDDIMPISFSLHEDNYVKYKDFSVFLKKDLNNFENVVYTCSYNIKNALYDFNYDCNNKEEVANVSVENILRITTIRELINKAIGKEIENNDYKNIYLDTCGSESYKEYNNLIMYLLKYENIGLDNFDIAVCHKNTINFLKENNYE